MDVGYRFIEDMAALAEIPDDGILTKTPHEDDDVKVVLFGFSAGQELSEHTAAKPAMLFFLRGRAEVTLGDDVLQVAEGAWVHMPPNLPHSIRATTEVAMLLILVKTHA